MWLPAATSFRSLRRNMVLSWVTHPLYACNLIFQRLTTLEKQSKEEKEAAKIMVVVLTCGIVASLLIGLTQH